MIRLTKYGIREWASSAILALMLNCGFLFIALYVNAPIGWTSLGVTTAGWLVIAAFFRVPSRKIPIGQHLIVAPADGMIKDIELLKNIKLECFDKVDVIQIGIETSIIDVHVNYAPTDFTVECKKYDPGKFYDAHDENSVKVNESMMIAGTASATGIKFPIGIKQSSKAIAKRIICQVEPYDNKLKKGEIYGMIKYGSRVELYLPASKKFEIKVKIGDRIFAGSTVMAEIKKG